jgi:hypothetical protein
MKLLNCASVLTALAVLSVPPIIAVEAAETAKAVLKDATVFLLDQPNGVTSTDPAGLQHGCIDSDVDRVVLCRGAQDADIFREISLCKGRCTESRAQMVPSSPLASPNAGPPDRHATGKNRSGAAGPRGTRCRGCALARSRRRGASQPLARCLWPASARSPSASSPVSHPRLPTAGRSVR